MKNSNFIGWLVVFMGLYYCLTETIFHGSKIFPQSDAELIEDGISGVLAAIGFVILSLPTKR
jgi:hypothetical protein